MGENKTIENFTRPLDTYRGWTWCDKYLSTKWPANVGALLPSPPPGFPIGDNSVWRATSPWRYLEEQDQTSFFNDYRHWMWAYDPIKTLRWIADVGAQQLPMGADLVWVVTPYGIKLEERNEADSYDTSARSMWRDLDLTKICLICRRMVGFANPPKFGILMNCNHPFCFKCIHSYMFGSKRRRCCPVCNVESNVVLRSITWETSRDAKRKLYKKFRDYTMRVPCKFYNSGNGVCRYGSYCYFKH